MGLSKRFKDNKRPDVLNCLWVLIIHCCQQIYISLSFSLSCNHLLICDFNVYDNQKYKSRRVCVFKTNRWSFPASANARFLYQESNWCQILKEYPCSLINSHITIWRSWSYKNHMNDVDPTTVKVIVGRWPCTTLSHEYAAFSVKKSPIPTCKHTPTSVSRRSVNDSFDTFLLFGHYYTDDVYRNYYITCTDKL